MNKQLTVESALVVAAHPDDEALGCGGTIAKLVEQHASVHVAFMADGVFSRSAQKDEHAQQLVARRDAARRACAQLGVKSVSFGEFPDNRMDSIPMLDIAQAVESLVNKYSPELILTHHAGDLNVDHQRLSAAVVTACRPQAGMDVRTILMFEVPSSTEWHVPGAAPAFAPNWYVDISKNLDRKIAALNEYSVEMREWPHPRSVRGVTHLAHWRGATVGVDAAEAFVLGRRID
ncbi:MAG: PIG-L family deacetylase [Gemmatimonadaceae bacterium]|nr:PIG-L family deacetylase [Gemmatimonadaceae bacterium]